MKFAQSCLLVCVSVWLAGCIAMQPIAPTVPPPVAPTLTPTLAYMPTPTADPSACKGIAYTHASVIGTYNAEKTLVAAPMARGVAIFDATSETLADCLYDHRSKWEHILEMQFSPDSALLAVLEEDPYQSHDRGHSLHIWDVAHNLEIVYYSSVGHIEAFSEDGHIITANVCTYASSICKTWEDVSLEIPD